MISQSTPVRFADALPPATEVVVIGAGVVGTATAWHLARQGVQVLLCEKGRVAGEQSSRNWGWIRQQGRDAAELPLMMESNRLWQALAAETGEEDLSFTPCGCLYLAESAADLARFEVWHELARAHQLDTRMLSAEQAAAAAGAYRGKWLGGMFTPSDGRGEPQVAVPALARAAQRLGVRVIENCAVRTVESAAGDVSAVVTEHGVVRCTAVVLAGGAWSTYLAANTGLDLAQLMVRSTVARTAAVAGPEIPNISAPGLCIRRRADGGYTVATGDLAEHYLAPHSFRYFGAFRKLLRLSLRDLRLRLAAPADYPGSWSAARRWSGAERSPFERLRVLDPPPSPLEAARLRRRLPQRAPWLAGVAIAELWAGMIDVTPDAVPYVCAAPAPRGLYIGTGLSGHGFGIGPAIGRVLADLVQGRPPGHDLHRFRFGRFGDGSPIEPGPY